MKRPFNFILIILLTLGCSSDSDSSSTDNDPVLNISNFTVSIDTPIQTRDYSYYNEGYDGIFENPDTSKLFGGSIDITYSANSSLLTYTEVEIIWRSNIDGVLFQGQPNSNYLTEINQTLSVGLHTITLEASIPSQNLMASASINLSNNIKLTTTKSGNGKSVLLNWTPYQGNDFISYLIYEEDFEPIAEITDINTIEYEDSTFSSLIEDVDYQIVVKTSQNYNHPVGSNISSMHPGVYIDFPYYVYKVIKDPLRSKVYALVRPRYNNYTSEKYGILIIDVGSDTYEISEHILQDERFTDLDISPDGQYLFLSQRRIEKITRVDLETLDTFIFVTDTEVFGIEWGIHKIEVGNNNVLYCHRAPPTSGGTQFWIYDGNNGDLIIGPTNGMSHGDIEVNNTNNALYGGESNTSNGTIRKWNANGNALVEQTSYTNAINSPSQFLLLSDDDQYLFYDNHQFDTDLNVVRTFNTDIKGCSTNNTYLSDFEKLYNYGDMSIVYQYPTLPNNENSSLVFMDDDTLIICRSYYENNFQDVFTYFFKIEIE